MTLYRYEDIKVVHLEITEKCQAACPMCNRNCSGIPGMIDGAINPNLGLHELTLADVQQLLPPEFVKQLDRLFMCGNFGDPIIATDTLEVFKYLRDQNKDLSLGMHTNGGAKKPEWWRELAKVLGNNGQVTFGFDGLKDTNHLYRQGVNWNIAWNNAMAFIEAGGKARWAYLIFAHNEHQVEEAEALAKETGFDKFMPKKTSRFRNSRRNKSNSLIFTDRKSKRDEILQEPTQVKYQNISSAKIPVLQEKYGSMNNYHSNVEIKCKVSKEKSIYLSAEGLLLPCCWIGTSMYKPNEKPGKNQIWDLITESGGKTAFDTKVHGIKEVLNNAYFTHKLSESWKTPNRPVICSRTCGIELDAVTSQFS